MEPLTQTGGTAGGQWSFWKQFDGEFDEDRKDYLLDDSTWKVAFGEPSGLAKSWFGFTQYRFRAAKWLLFVLWLLISAWSVAEWLQRDIAFGYWMTYLTHWVLVLQLIHFFLSAFSAQMAAISSLTDGKGELTPGFVRVAWFFNSLFPVSALVVVVLYWLANPADRDLRAISFCTHGLNLVLCLVDTMISRHPYYLAHVYVPMIASGSYSLFTFAYFKAGGKSYEGDPYIYSAFDWRQPMTGPALLLIVGVGGPVLYTMLFFMARCRQRWSQAEVPQGTSVP